MDPLELGKALETVWAECERLLDPDAAAFGRRVYETPLSRYVDRLTAVGLAGRERTLDAGCGFGQWSVALAQESDAVSAVDTAPDRLFVLQRLSRLLALPVEPRFSSLTELPFPDRSFDGILCYGVLFCTPWRESLAELARVLAPGGRLYVNANEIGWTVHQWLQRPHASQGFDPRDSAARALQNTLDYERHGSHPGGQLLIRREDLLDELAAHGLEVVGHGAEGEVRLADGAPAARPFFAGEYHGLPGVYEVVADRPR